MYWSKDSVINWEQVKENHSLEDFYNFLYRNKPHKKSKLFKEWDHLESITYEELLNEEERPHECEKIINQIIEFLKKQKEKIINMI